MNMHVVVVFVLTAFLLGPTVTAALQSRHHNVCGLSNVNKQTPRIPGSHSNGRCLLSHTAAQPQTTGNSKPSGLCFERISDTREAGQDANTSVPMQALLVLVSVPTPVPLAVAMPTRKPHGTDSTSGRVHSLRCLLIASFVTVLSLMHSRLCQRPSRAYDVTSNSHVQLGFLQAMVWEDGTLAEARW